MGFLAENWMWVGLALASGGMLLWEMTHGDSGLSPAQATLLINREDAVVLDVRESQEWSAGHIPNARHIALAQFDKRIVELDKLKERSVIVCCATGNRSAAACKRLREAGFAKVFNMSGGIAAWKEAGLPITTKG